MIAVFCQHREDFEYINLIPKDQFKIIRHKEDLIGMKFSAVLKLHNWWIFNKEVTEAYEYLEMCQPELFKTK